MNISNQVFSKERSLYNIHNATLTNVRFEGAEDGESPLKECSNLTLLNCSFSLRYPCWHDNDIVFNDCVFLETCRAPFWYDNGIEMKNSIIKGVKALRESKNIKISGTDIHSEEFAWRCHNIHMENCQLSGEYAFFEDENLTISNLKFTGKYSFQYNRNLVIKNSNIDTKDAFWHIDGAVVSDSIIKGEYLGWYSHNLTFIRCKIISHQPLCYCHNLELIDCEMDDCDLAFEYSDVKAMIKGKISSIKNPLSGSITADEIGEIINDDDKFDNNCVVSERHEH